MKSGIYKITYNDSVYVGSSNNIPVRWASHKSALKHNKHRNKILQRIYNKHGLQSLSFNVIRYIDKYLVHEEQSIINLYLHLNINILNLAKDVKKTTKGYKFSDKSKDVISSKLKGNKNSVNVKGYWFVYNNSVIHIVNLNKYCKDNLLNVSAMWSVANGKKNTYKGYAQAILRNNVMIRIYETSNPDDKYCTACLSYREDPNKKRRYFVKDVWVNHSSTTQERYCEDCLRDLLREIQKVRL